MPNLKRKVALITGASSGIGKGTAEYFATLGCQLSLNGRREEALKETALSCLKNGLTAEQVMTVVGDVEKEDSLKELVEKSVSHFGHLDILVNSAGMATGGMVEDSSIEEYDKTMSINIRSVVVLTKLCLPHLKKSKGSIVNVSSINGPCSFPGVTYYCMSKAAMDQFTKCMALELAKDGVRVNSVNPGVIVTNFHKNMGQSQERYAQFLEHSKTTHALGRVGEVIEVAKAIAFLASEDASFTTGDLLRIDGGRGIMTPR